MAKTATTPRAKNEQYRLNQHTKTTEGRVMDRGSAVRIATCYGLDGPGIESRWGEDVFSSRHPSREVMGPTQPPVCNGYRGSSRGVKWPGGGVHHPPPASTNAQTGYSYTSTPFCDFMVCTRETLYVLQSKHHLLYLGVDGRIIRRWKLKEEALARTLSRTRFGGGYKPVVRQTAE